MRRAILASVLLASTALAQEAPTGGNVVEPDAEVAAQQSLSTLRKLTTPENAARMGFSSPKEAAQATLTHPLRVYLVRVDELRQYSAPADPSALLHPLDKIIALVAVGGEVKSSIVVEKKGEQWKATRFGSPNLAKLLSQARDASVSARAPSADACFVVHVPGLNRYFIGYRSVGTLMLTPVQDDAPLEFQAGRPVPASEVFAKLAVTARNSNELPG